MPLNPMKIKARREKLKLTQLQAADACGMARPNWARLEMDPAPDVRVSTVEDLARVLRCSVAHLLAK